jgi:hypothetical protein
MSEESIASERQRVKENIGDRKHEMHESGDE